MKSLQTCSANHKVANNPDCTYLGEVVQDWRTSEVSLTDDVQRLLQLLLRDSVDRKRSYMCMHTICRSWYDDLINVNALLASG